MSLWKLSHILSYIVTPSLTDEDSIQVFAQVRTWSKLLTEFVQDHVKLLKVDCLFEKLSYKSALNYQQTYPYVVDDSKLSETEKLIRKRDEKISSHLKYLVNCFPNLETLSLNSIQGLSTSTLEYLNDNLLKLKVISIYGCVNVTSFNCQDISRFEAIFCNSTVMGCSTFKRIRKGDRSEQVLFPGNSVITIYVKNLTGAKVEMKVKGYTTIDEISTILKEFKHIPSYRTLAILHEGKVLGQYKSISDLNIHEGTTLNGYLRM